MPEAENNNRFWNFARKSEGLSCALSERIAFFLSLGERIEVRVVAPVTSDLKHDSTALIRSQSFL
jgi:hypothetical protein